MIIGNVSALAFDIQEKSIVSELQTVDIVISNRYICCDDNSAFVPHFIRSLQFDIGRIRKNNWSQFQKYFEGKSINEVHEFILQTRTEGREEYDIENDDIYSFHSFLNWGPTTDNLLSFIIPWNDRYYLTYQFWRPEHSNKSEVGIIYSLEIDLPEFAKTIEEAISALKK